ncbi:hypothetical protein ACFFRR_008391 [Megaselia abdita]
MKLLLFCFLVYFYFLLLSCFSIAVFGINAVPISSSVPTEDFGEAVKNYLEKMKKVLPCGQPSMAPFTKSFVPISSRTSDIELELNITNLYVSGANTFEIVASVYDNETQEYYLHLNSPHSQVLGSYSLYSKVNVGGIPVVLTGKGFINLTAQGTRVVITFVFGKNSQNGNLKMENLAFSDIAIGQFDSRITGFMGDENYSNFLNNVFEKAVGLSQSDLFQQLLTTRSEAAMKAFNQVVSQFQNVNEVTEALVKSTGILDAVFPGQPHCTLN